jgi:hypothetical protein
VPDDADAALLLIDVVRDLEFGGGVLLTSAPLMAEQIAALKRPTTWVGISNTLQPRRSRKAIRGGLPGSHLGQMARWAMRCWVALTPHRSHILWKRCHTA